MDSFGIATLITCGLVCVALFFHFYYRKKLRLEAEFNLLNTIATEHNSTINVHDSWDKIHIGMDDQESHKLFFIRTTPDQEIREVINLSEVKKCHFEKRIRTYKNHKDKAEIVEKIDLVFSFIAAGKPAVRLEFYNNDYDALTLSGELQLAMKWEEIVNKTMSGIKKKEPSGPIHVG